MLFASEFLLLISLFVVLKAEVIVDTKYGQVIGQTHELHDGKSVNSFLGIPFAKPPLLGLRWQPPEEPDPWDEPFIADELGQACAQTPIGLVWVTHLGWNRFGEDCLNLNVYTPEDMSNGPYPTMVYMYGGGYQMGANIQYPSYFLAAKDVVVVVPNYRLEIIGYASTDDDVAPGNYGMLDQHLALQWVQENIMEFGGNPGDVTIFGESAGACSVGLHLVSPMSTGLFHKAILQSGTEMLHWAYAKEGSHAEMTRGMGEELDCPTEDSQELMNCLRTFTPRQLRQAYGNCSVCSTYRPIVDGEGGFLPDTPEYLRETGNFNMVPEIVGINKEEMFALLVGEIIYAAPERSLIDFSGEDICVGTCTLPRANHTYTVRRKCFEKPNWWEMSFHYFGVSKHKARVCCDMKLVLENTIRGDSSVATSGDDGYNRTEFERWVKRWTPEAADPDEQERVDEAYLFYYTPWPHIDDGILNRDQLGHIYTDDNFGYGMDLQLRSHTEYAPTYQYIYAHVDRNDSFLFPDWLGAVHFAEVPIVFGYPFLELNEGVFNESEFVSTSYGDTAREYSDFMATMWTNFAKYGDPTPEPVDAPGDLPPVSWVPYTPDEHNYILIDTDVIETRQDYRSHEYSFLNYYMRLLMPGGEQQHSRGGSRSDVDLANAGMYARFPREVMETIFEFEPEYEEEWDILDKY